MSARALITAVLLATITLQAMLGGVRAPSLVLCFAADTAPQAPQAASPTRCACGHDAPPDRPPLPTPRPTSDHGHDHGCTDIVLALADLTSVPRDDASLPPDVVSDLALIALPDPPATRMNAPAHADRPRHEAGLLPHPSVGAVRAVRLQV